MTDLILDTFALAYIEAALFSSTNESGEPLDGLYTIDDIHADTLALMVADCEDFRTSFEHCFPFQAAHAGQDFWLTRNGHGAGFWDGDWATRLELGQYATVGDYLTAMSKPYGEFNLYVGDDGMIHGS